MVPFGATVSCDPFFAFFFRGLYRKLLLSVSFAGPSAWAFISGIDIGSEFSKFAVVLPKQPPEVVVNMHSQRKTPTAFSVVGQKRAFGDTALQYLTSMASSVVRFFPTLLGQKVDQLSAPAAPGLPSDLFPFQLRADHERWAYRFLVGDLDLSVEEVVAHFLAYGHEISAAAANGAKKVEEVVMTMPASATQRHRQALLHAAEIAGMSKVRLVHEISAAAIQRALDLKAEPEAKADADSNDKDLEPTEDDSPKEKLRKIQAKRARREKAKRKKKTRTTSRPVRFNVLFINMGSRHLEVCVVRYKILGKETSVHVKGCGASVDVGGHFFDLAIAKKMQEKAASEHAPGELEHNPKALQKLLAQATKTKHQLSVNKEVLFAVEALHADTDFSYTITRVEFEAWCVELFPLITETIEIALKSASVDLKGLEAVEVIGGGWRVPAVQRTLSKYFADKLAHEGARGEDASSQLTLGQHLNGEEAAALGAAYYAASTSEAASVTSGPRLRQFPLTDIVSHDYALSLHKLNKSQPGPEFTPKPQVIFKRGSDLVARTEKLRLKAVQCDMRFVLYEGDRAIESHHVTGLRKAHVNLYKSSDPPNVTVSIELDSNGLVHMRQVEAEFQVLEKPQVDHKTKMTMAPKMGHKKIRLQGTVDHEWPAPMSRLERIEARKRFRDLGEKDRAATKALAARSNLEAYIYSAREKLDAQLSELPMAQERLAELRAMLDEAESWLEAGDSGAAQGAEGAEAYLARLTALKRAIDPMMLREISEGDTEREPSPPRGNMETPKERAARIARKNAERKKRESRPHRGDRREL